MVIRIERRIYQLIPRAIILPPFPSHYVLPSLHDRFRLIDRVGQEAELAGDEGAIFGVAGVGGDVDDVEGLVEEGEESGELGEGEWGGYSEGVGGEGAGRGEGGEAEGYVLGWWFVR